MWLWRRWFTGGGTNKGEIISSAVQHQHVKRRKEKRANVTLGLKERDLEEEERKKEEDKELQSWLQVCLRSWSWWWAAVCLFTIGWVWRIRTALIKTCSTDVVLKGDMFLDLFFVCMFLYLLSTSLRYVYFTGFVPFLLPALLGKTKWGLAVRMGGAGPAPHLVQLIGACSRLYIEDGVRF